MKYPMRPNQTIEYNTLHAIENGATQALWVGVQLRRAGIEYKPRQIYGAMQRLRKDGVIEKVGGLWRLCADPPTTLEKGIV